MNTEATYITHDLKVWPEYYKDLIFGVKTFELRKMDRDYQIGDLLRLHEWNPTTKTYTDRYTEYFISHILKGPCFGLEAGYGIISLVPHDEDDEISITV